MPLPTPSRRPASRPLALAVTASLVALSGCSLFPRLDPEASTFGLGGGRVNSAGVSQLLPASFEQVDLVRLLAPSGLSIAQTTACHAAAPKDDDAREACLIDAAFNVRRASGIDTPALRNAIQDRLIAASDQRCNVYLIYLQRSHAATGFALGSLTTALGGAGAIVTGASSARALAGAAGIVSGTRAEYEQAYFHNQTVNLIAAGIRKRRTALQDGIDKRRGRGAQITPLADYTTERAIGDALRYHGACSLIAGLEESNITMNLDAGIEGFARTRAAVAAAASAASQ